MNKTFRQIFEEDGNECLTLLNDIRVNGENIAKGSRFNLDQPIGGVNFHRYRYLDMSVEIVIEEGKEIWEIKKFLPGS